MLVYPFCRFFAYRRRDLFFTRFGKSQTFNDCTKRFLHDKERMISSVLINEKMTDRTLMNAVGRLLIKFLLLLSLYNLLFKKTFFIPYIRLYFLNTSNLISSIFFESFSSRLWSFSSLRACFIKASSHSRPCL